MFLNFVNTEVLIGGKTETVMSQVTSRQKACRASVFLQRVGPLSRGLIGVTLNLLILFQTFAQELNQVTFDTPEWQPYQPVAGEGWQIEGMAPQLTGEGAGAGGAGKALRVPADKASATRVTRMLSFEPSEKISFVDFKIKPSADELGNLGTLHVNGAQLAFQLAEDGQSGELWVYHGNDAGVPDSENQQRWIRTSARFALNGSGAAAAGAMDYQRVTVRHDSLGGIWDVYVDGKPAAMNLGFSGRRDDFGGIDFFGSTTGDTLIDDLAALHSNMLFTDQDKDGLPDDFERANGGNTQRNDRNLIKPGTDDTFLDIYLSSLEKAQAAVQGETSSTLGAARTNLALTAAAEEELPHQPVGALKGALSVAADGSSTYTLPLDLPAGTAGMAPQLSLAYSSAGGNGVLGLGWSVGGLQQITRGPSSAAKDGAYAPVDFTGEDRFFLNGQRLVRIKTAADASTAEYRTEIESGARITSYGANQRWWKVETKSGLIMEFGNTDDSRLSVAKGTLAWAVNQVSDTSNNYYSLHYTSDALAGVDHASHRLTQIRYTGNRKAGISPYCTVDFSYEGRPDAMASSSRFATSRMDKRLAKIRVSTGSTVNHSYRFAYRQSYQTGRSLLASITKHASDADALGSQVPPTVFEYDGLTEPENQDENPLWEPSPANKLRAYGNDLDSTGEVNSMVIVGSSETSIQLRGDVARAYLLPGGGYQVTPNTRIRFDVQSSRLTKGAFIGLDSDLSYDRYASLYRIGGDGSASLGAAFTGPVLPHTPGETQTLDRKIGQLGTGQKGRLVLILVDEQSEDGEDVVTFSNIRLYEEGENHASISPIRFRVATQLPVFSDANGNDMGIVPLDLNSDGRLDLADWRAVAFQTQPDGTLLPQVAGSVYLNTGIEEGSGFVANNSYRPTGQDANGTRGLPLSTQSDFPTAHTIARANDVLARPIDIDGDGYLDLLAPYRSQIDNVGRYSNTFAFHTHYGNGWQLKDGWSLPFRLVSTSGPKARRSHYSHFADLNADGWPDLIIATTSISRLVSTADGQELAAPNTAVAFLNKGKNGPGWIFAPNLGLPAPLLHNNEDTARRLIDWNGDGYPELVKSRFQGGNTVKEIHRLLPPRYNSWTPKEETGETTNPFLPPVLFQLSNGNPMPALILDLNGDGLPDLLESIYDGGNFLSKSFLNTAERDSTPWQAQGAFSTGSYKFPVPLAYKSGEANETRYIPYGHEIADLNGDGLIDILYSDINNHYNANQNNLACLNTGTGWRMRTNWGLPGTERIFQSGPERNNGKRRARLLDVNGDGFPDLLTNLLGETPRVWLNRCKPEVLTTVTDGFGAVLSVGYRRMNDPEPIAEFGKFHQNADGKPLPKRIYEKSPGPLPQGQSTVIDARPLVCFLGEPDGQGGTRKRFYRYGDLRYDRFNEASLGFGFTETLDNLNSQLSRTDTARQYPHGGSPLQIRTWVRVNPADRVEALSELPDTDEPYNRLLSQQTFSYESTPSYGGRVLRLDTTTSESRHMDLNGTILAATLTSNEEIDHLGFPRKVVVTQRDGSTVTTQNTYRHIATTSDWFPGRLEKSIVTKTAPGTPQITRTSTFGYSSATGLLTSETIEPGHAKTRSTSYLHDDFGNVIRTTATTPGSAARTSSTDYTPDGRFPIKATNQLNHSVATAYDRPNALIQSTTDANGLTTAYQYDRFGTRTRSNFPDATSTSEATGYATLASLPAAVARNVGHPIVWYRAILSSGSPAAKVYFDTLGREVISETRILRNASLTGDARYQNVYTVTHYNRLGLKTKVSQPFASGETVLYTTFTYDLLNRLLTTTHPDGTTDKLLDTRSAFHESAPVTYTKARNRDGAILERWVDLNGRLVKSRDESQQTTLFRYDVDGRLLSTSIEGKTLLTNQFDIFGNRESVWEANSGTSRSTYNGFGEVVSTTNARNQTTTFTYDILGRPATITRPGNEGTWSFTYDNATGKAIGQPWKTTGPGGYLSTIAYDSLGRPASTTLTRDGKTFVSTTSYDTLGRPSTTRDAGGLAIVHEYDSLTSQPLSATIAPGQAGGNTVLWQAGTFDSQGRAITQTLAHGVTRRAEYETDTGLLTSLFAKRNANTLQNKTYTWSPIGNLKTRNDLLTGIGETFTYDNLNRLRSARSQLLPGFTSPGSLPGTAWFSYDIAGNLLSKSGATLEYAHPTRPHAVTSATIHGVKRNYTYDATGAVTSDGLRTYQWSSTGQLQTLTHPGAPELLTIAGTRIDAPADIQTTFQFGPTGDRHRQLKQRTVADGSATTEETLYLGSYELETHHKRAAAPGSTPEWTRTVHRHTLPGGAIYTRTSSATEPTTIRLGVVIADHLGSTDCILTSIWNNSSFDSFTTQRMSFDAWGQRRDRTNHQIYRKSTTDPFRTNNLSSLDYNRGFTGHEQLDDTGLIHMNGRIYDPELGRMLSTDPFVQVPEYSQNFNRYSYVLNNPLNMTDPSGYSWLSKAFSAAGDWLSENWRTVASIAVGALLVWSGIGASIFWGLHGLTGASIVGTHAAVVYGGIGAVTGTIMGGINAAFNGGNIGDIARGALVGGIEGGLSGALHMVGGSVQMSAANIVGHGVVGGAANEAMGGKFQDGFLSASASAATAVSGLTNPNTDIGQNLGFEGRTAIASIAGGTASALGGGKFSNGAWTGAFHHMLNAEGGGFISNFFGSISRFISQLWSNFTSLFNVAQVSRSVSIDASAPWMSIAHAEIGQKEFSSGWNPRIKEYQGTSVPGYFNDDGGIGRRNSWCACFVTWALKKTGITPLSGYQAMRASAYLSYGESINSPIYGAIAIQGSGHVGFVYGVGPAGQVAMLGGNQGDAVNIRLYSLSAAKSLTYRWPSAVPRTSINRININSISNQGGVQ